MNSCNYDISSFAPKSQVYHQKTKANYVELQGKATQNEIATTNDHKCDVFILHIFPMLSTYLLTLGTFTPHPEIVIPSTKTD